ncbi:serine/threonine-protein kinase [Pseudonocardia sp. GCM10023141]|uniref:serine/threonine-protein kinase n=1 Tax=Pseudonocardia sp. GCM10023141 TaxID=3252653 RepID=UPI00361C392F
MSDPTTEDSAVRIGGRYRLDVRIGAGAMGAVWRGTDELLNRTVAVKELLAAAAPPTAAGVDALEESRQRLLREGRISAKLQHAHVISMFDVVVHDDRPWLVMEYLPSKSLAQLVAEKGPLDTAEVAAIGRAVADGLAAAHLAGVVHRDVKPGNVLIGDDGRVKLTDFGVSRAVDDVQLTRTGLIAGTPAFLAPEIAQGREPTAASDIFSLGATLYAAIEGKPPFGLDDNAYALLHRVATETPPVPEHAGPLTGIITRLLSVNPADRPSAAQARDALAPFGLGSSVPAPSLLMGAAPAILPSPGPATVADTPPVPPDAAPRRSRRAPVLLGAIGVLVVGGGVTAALLMANNGGAAGSPQAAPPAAVATSTAPVAPPVQPTTAAPPTTTPAPTTPPASGVTDPVAFVQSYYALLPGNTAAAFAMLSPDAQGASRGQAGYDDFYGGMQSVSLENVRQTGDNSVDATVVFVTKAGATSREPYHFVMSTVDGRTIMQSFSKA